MGIHHHFSDPCHITQHVGDILHGHIVSGVWYGTMPFALGQQFGLHSLLVRYEQYLVINQCIHLRNGREEREQIHWHDKIPDLFGTGAFYFAWDIHAVHIHQ